MEENNNEKNVNEVPRKSNFVPSYSKKEQPSNEGKNVKTKKKRVKSKISFILLIAIVAAIIFCLYYFVFRNTPIIKSSYEEQMEDYGYATLYDNGESTGANPVTKAEAIKMVLATTLNTDDIEDYLSSDIEEEYKNSRWVYYAKAIELISENDITSENYNEQEEYKNVIRYYGMAKLKILGKTLDTSKEPSFKDYNTYTIDERNAISDLVFNGMLEDSTSDLNGNQKLTKSKLNRIVIEFVLKYNLISVDGERININKDKMPSNAKEFPYTLANINKSVYETENYVADKDNYKNARKVYAELKNRYKEINSTINEYFSTMLNVDYENLNEEEFLNAITRNSHYTIDDDTVKEYIKYVKENKIKMSGESKVQFPIIYFDGNNYRVRVKLTLNITSADKLQDLILGDNNQTYKTGTSEMYVDVPMFYSDINESYFISFRSLKDMKSGSVHEEIIEEKQEELSEEMKELIEWQNSLTEEDLSQMPGI